MKELYNILEKEKDVNDEIKDIDVTDEEIIQYFKENPDELKKKSLSVLKMLILMMRIKKNSLKR